MIMKRGVRMNRLTDNERLVDMLCNIDDKLDKISISLESIASSLKKMIK